MKQEVRRIILLIAVTVILFGYMNGAAAQVADEFSNDDMRAVILVNGENLASAVSAGDAITVDTSTPVEIYFEFTITSPVDLILHNLSLIITYADIQIFTYPHDLGDLVAPTGTSGNITTWVTLDPIIESTGIPVATGVFRIAWYLHYSRSGDPTLLSIGTDTVYVNLPGNPVFSAVGGVAALSTVAVAYSLLSSLFNWMRLIRAAGGIYGISSKSRQILNLPLMALVGLVPVISGLFSRKGKQLTLVKETFDQEVGDRIRTRGAELWPGTHCPKCGRRIKSNKEVCKCKLPHAEAPQYFGDELLTLAHKATSVVGKRKTISVKALKKKLKISKTQAAELSGILTQEGIFEVQGLKGPLIKLSGNGLSVAFLIITWSQLYAVDVYGLVEILGITSTGFSVALILGVLLQYRTTKNLQKNKATFEASAPLPPPSAPSASPEELLPKTPTSPESIEAFAIAKPLPDLEPLDRVPESPMPEDPSTEPLPPDTPSIKKKKNQDDTVDD